MLHDAVDECGKITHGGVRHLQDVQNRRRSVWPVLPGDKLSGTEKSPWQPQASASRAEKAPRELLLHMAVGTMQSVAPCVSVQNSSHSETPKMNCVLNGTQSPTCTVYADCIQLVRISSAPCPTITPLGRPVVPEVYIT